MVKKDKQIIEVQCYIAEDDMRKYQPDKDGTQIVQLEIQCRI